MSRDSRNNPSQGKLIGLAIVLLFTAPQLILPILVIWGIITAVKKASATQPKDATPRFPAAKQESFDDCPQPLFCFHKDKGEHHVRRGKEIDPWDRPDIDISKYQRRN